MPNKIPLTTRFWNRVNKTETCWLWIGGTWDGRYGTFSHKPGHSIAAHRFAYELSNGAIPPGLTIDHLCGVTLCVNPEHLEAVTLRVNILRSNAVSGLNSRKRLCSYGHALLGTNLVIDNTGRRQCHICINRRAQESRARHPKPPRTSWPSHPPYGPAAANAAKTHCPKGHPLSGANLITTNKGARRCRICRNAQAHSIPS